MPRPAERASCEHGEGMLAIVGLATHIVDGGGFGTDEFTEPAPYRVTELLTGAPALRRGQLPGQELFRFGTPARHGPRGADSGADRSAVGVQRYSEGAHRDDHGVAWADLRELFGTVRQRVMDRGDQFVRLDGGSFRADVEVVRCHDPVAADRGEFDAG